MTVFFAAHDPITPNRQGKRHWHPIPRAVIFYANEAQKQQADAFIKELNSAKNFKNLIVTTLKFLTEFYPRKIINRSAI